MLKKDSVYVYLKDDDNEKIRKAFRDLNFEVDEFPDGRAKQLRYDIYRNISRETKKELLEIIRLPSDKDFSEFQRRFMHLHYEEVIFCGLPYEFDFPKAMRLINYGVGALRHDEILLTYGSRYFLQAEKRNGIYGDNKLNRIFGDSEDILNHTKMVDHSDVIDFHDIEIPLSKKDEKLSNIYAGKEKLKITSTNMIYPEVYEELYKVKKLIEEGKYIDFYINMLNYSHKEKIRNMLPYTGEVYEPYSPDEKARQIHLSRAQWETPPKNKEELSERINFLLQHIFEIDKVECYKLENNYKEIIL